MNLINLKLLKSFEKHLREHTVITKREAYMRRFKVLHRVMMDGVDAHHDRENGSSWFLNVDYEALSLSDIEWISDELNDVPNAENGESFIEDVSEEVIWMHQMLKSDNSSVGLSMIRCLPAVRTVEDFF